MTITNFDNYEFRCSMLGSLMTNPKSKKELLSQTTKKYLETIWIKETFGREKDLVSKYLEKGTEVEENSLTLATKTERILLVKNKEELHNGWIKGTPDVILKNKIIDIKSSWDIWTFFGANGSNKNYLWQLTGYMWLTGLEFAELLYCLVDTPEYLRVDEIRRTAFATGLLDTTEEFAQLEKDIDHNLTYTDISEDIRVHKFIFEFDSLKIEKLQPRILACRAYLNSLNDKLL